MDAAAGDPDVLILSAVIRTLSAWQDGEPLNSPGWSDLEANIARMQGRSGVPMRWRITGPFSAEAAEKLTALLRRQAETGLAAEATAGMRFVFAEGLSGRVNLPPSADAEHTVAVCSVFAREAREIEISIAGGSALTLCLNGDPVVDRPQVATDARPVDRKKCRLRAGMNHLVVDAWGADNIEWELWFRTVGSQAEHERLTQLVLDGQVTSSGRESFRNVERSLCSCHRLNGGGARSDRSTGVGNRFAIHLIESILTPSRAMHQLRTGRRVARQRRGRDGVRCQTHPRAVDRRHQKSCTRSSVKSTNACAAAKHHAGRTGQRLSAHCRSDRLSGSTDQSAP
jgi:hypothetical protein